MLNQLFNTHSFSLSSPRLTTATIKAIEKYVDIDTFNKERDDILNKEINLHNSLLERARLDFKGCMDKKLSSFSKDLQHDVRLVSDFLVSDRPKFSDYDETMSNPLYDYNGNKTDNEIEYSNNTYWSMKLMVYSTINEINLSQVLGFDNVIFKKCEVDKVLEIGKIFHSFGFDIDVFLLYDNDRYVRVKYGNIETTNFNDLEEDDIELIVMLRSI